VSSFTALGAFWRVVELDCGEVGAVVEAAIAPTNGLLCCRPALVGALSHASFVFPGPLLPQVTEINKWRSIGGWSRVRQWACRGGADGSSTPARLLLLMARCLQRRSKGGVDKVASSSF